MIRKMDIKDIPEIVRDEERIFKNSLGYEMLKNDSTTNEMAHYFVYELDDKLIGYIGLWIDEFASQILNFYIKEEYQGHGFGKELLDYALMVIKNNNVDIITLEVRETNLKAIKLYENKGFVLSHKRKNYYPDCDALVLMKK